MWTKIFWMIAHFTFWLVILSQLFLLLFFFFSLIIADYEERFLIFLKWLFWLFWYVYFLPLHKYGFSKWQNWVYFCRHHAFTSPDFLQRLCEPTPWLLFMFFYTFLCFFYEWSLKRRYDRFLIFLLWVIGFVLFTV